jgi:alanine dehydrogenase
MLIGVPTEVKTHEYRVGLVPGSVRELVHHGHKVVVESGAGAGIGFDDRAYESAGAEILVRASDVFAAAELIVKVKEPQPAEVAALREDQILFTYLHLAADRGLTEALLRSGAVAIAYETVTDKTGGLPLLAPMSEVAGRLAPIVGANAMLKPNGGPGLLVPGVPGTYPAKVVVIGGGVAGANAVAVSVGLGADVTVLDTNLGRLAELDSLYAGRVHTIASNGFEIERALLTADLVIGSVLIPGAKAPKLVSNDLVSRMKRGSVLVDIAVDQGGCFADSHPTTHEDPTFMVHGSLFYCVANMPGAVPNTSTYALTNATMPYVRAIANLGWKQAMKADAALARGLNTHDGHVTNPAVANAHHLTLAAMGTVLD